MKKPKLLLSGPVLTASGYGVHARQVLKALVDGGRFDVYATSIRWGETAFLTGPEHDWIRELVERPRPDRFDISVQVTIPNEFKRQAPLSIGITAGIEVDRVSPEWLVKCNSEVDLVVVPSQHSARSFSVQYGAPDGRTLALQKPIIVLHEGVDIGRYHPAEEESQLLTELGVPAKNLVCVGLGLDKPEGQDRKNITRLVEWFARAFKGRSDVGLVLKVGIVNGSNLDFEIVKRRVSDIKRLATGGDSDPPIFLVHGRLSEDELRKVYNDRRISAMVSLTHGEGFGLPLLEAAACDLPVIATDWSGHLDFLSKDGQKLFVPIPAELTEIPQPCAWPGVMEAGTRWATPKEEDAVDRMRRMFLSDETPRKWARELGEHVRENFSLEATGKRLEEAAWAAWAQTGGRAPSSRDDLIAAMRAQVREKGPSLIYTMPMSAGDVFLSLDVVNALRQKHEGHRVYFATLPQYFDILKGDPRVDEVVEWLPWMQDVSLLEDVFDEVYTPNLAVQMAWSNWVHKGKGRHLQEEFATQCGVTLEDRFPVIPKGHPLLAPDHRWVAIHAGGQKSARQYAFWNDVVSNLDSLKELGIRTVQIGAKDDVSVGKIDVDLRGETSHLGLIENLDICSAFVGIDSYPMHVADALGVPIVVIFGSSYSRSTGPRWPDRTGNLPVLIETPSRNGCDRACYKDVCKIDASNPCINNISPRDIFDKVVEVLELEPKPFKVHRPKIAGYTHIYNPKTHGYPFVQSIASMLLFCNEIIVVDGGSTDGSLEQLREELFFVIKTPDRPDGKIQIVDRPWDPDEPGMDGMQKAFGRAMVSPEMEFLWQQDADEIVHPDDADKIVDACRRFPADVDVIHLPVIELWGDDRTCRTDRHSWKWRLSRNNFRITHGINAQARLMDPKTGRFFAKEGMSDGCEYIDIVSGEHLPHRGFYTEDLERLRREDPESYGKRMNEIFQRLPCVWHYSWADLPRKIKNFRDFWDNQWNVLYQRPARPRFPDVKTDEDVTKKAEELRARGGEHGSSPTFKLERESPPGMKGWG